MTSQNNNNNQGKDNSGNFKNDPGRAAEAGRKGGQKSKSGGQNS